MPTANVRIFGLFQHTAARRRLGASNGSGQWRIKVSTHSRPKAAGKKYGAFWEGVVTVSTHSRPKAAGKTYRFRPSPKTLFQHTAARRRLDRSALAVSGKYSCFNTQPPEGGWSRFIFRRAVCWRFQHTAARRRLASTANLCVSDGKSFNTQPPEGGWRTG